MAKRKVETKIDKNQISNLIPNHENPRTQGSNDLQLYHGI
jgi:hypothetical protein